MLTRTQIRKLSNASFYQRGLDLYREDKVEEFSAASRNQEDYIKALVKGSGRNHYQVTMSFDHDQNRLTSRFCECPAFASYSVLCKHCVAVLLEYEDYKERQTVLDRYFSTMKLDNEKARPVRKSSSAVVMNSLPRMRTTPEVKALLEKRLYRKTAPILHKEIFGKVKLEPIVNGSRGSVHIEFKIGAARMYVVKDVFEFARHMENEEEFAYGQKLKFFHVPEVFEARSAKLAKFLVKWTRRYRSQNGGQRYYGSSWGYGQQAGRSIALSGSDLEEFLDAMEDVPFMGNINFTGERMWRPAEAALSRTLKITSRGGGIEVSADEMVGYEGIDSTIYFIDGQVYRIPKEETSSVQEFFRCIQAAAGRKVLIQKEDVPAFCRELLPELEKHFECIRENFSEDDYGVASASFEIYLDAPQQDLITCRIMAVYGEKKYNVYDENTDRESRDIVQEIQIRTAVDTCFNAFDEQTREIVLSGDDQLLYELLTQGIPRMQLLGEVFISDRLKRFKVAESPKVTVGISLSGDLLELTMTSDNMPLDQLLEILSRYNRKTKFYRLKNGDFVNVDEERIGALLELKQGLNLTEAQLKSGSVELPKYRALYLDAEMKECPVLPVVKNRSFKALVRNMKTVEDSDFELPASLHKVLREYQKKGFLWLKTLKQNGFGGILADDMGLGKTLQVIAFLLSEYQESESLSPEHSISDGAIRENRRCLIVSPASLVFNWGSEIERFAPGLPYKMVIGNASERKDIIRQAGEKEILLTSYDLLKRDIDEYSDISFFCQVIDEAQYIKNHNTQASKAVKSIRAGCRLALTGTPVENRLSELWSIFDYVMPGFLYPYARFREEMEVPIVQDQDDRAMNRLQKMIRPFVLRRLKKDVLKDLPDKMEENVMAQMGGEQQKLYDAHVTRLKLMLDGKTDEEFRRSKIQVLSELTKLRQLCCNPALLYGDYHDNSAKTQLCLDLILNAVGAGHKILLFSQFTSMLEILQEHMDKEGISYYALTGATSKEKRRELVENFNRDNTDVFCISLKAGGTGLNLTAADIVIHYDPWWNLAVQNQATDRAHRIGQKNAVTVYKLLMKGTIEENISRLQERKRELADKVLGGEGLDTGSFSRDELLELLK